MFFIIVLCFRSLNEGPYIIPGKNLPGYTELSTEQLRAGPWMVRMGGERECFR